MAILKSVKVAAEAARQALGMTAKELAQMSAEEFSKLTNAQLKGALRTMQKATSQRKIRLEKSGVFSEALQSFTERGGIKTDLKNRVAMQAELKRAIQFMNSKTATITGARAVEKQAREAIGLPPSASAQQVNETWDLFHRLQEEYPGYLRKEAMNKLRYKNTQDAVGKAYRAGMDPEQISSTVRQMYEQAEQGNSRAVTRLIKSLKDYGKNAAEATEEY